MSYLVPPLRLSDGERQAVRDVASLMEQGAEDRADEELQQQANAVEDADAAFDPASGLESPSTQRILDAYDEIRAQRGGADAVDDFYLSDVDANEAALAEHTDDAAVREARAVASVARALRGEADEDAEGRSRRPAAVRVRYHDEERDDMEDASEPLRSVLDDAAAMDTFLPNLPDSQPERERRVAEANAFDFDDPTAASPAPEPAPVKDADDGYAEDRGEYEGPKVASEPPTWVAPHERG